MTSKDKVRQFDGTAWLVTATDGYDKTFKATILTYDGESPEDVIKVFRNYYSDIEGVLINSIEYISNDVILKRGEEDLFFDPSL